MRWWYGNGVNMRVFSHHAKTVARHLKKTEVLQPRTPRPQENPRATLSPHTGTASQDAPHTSAIGTRPAAHTVTHVTSTSRHPVTSGARLPTRVDGGGDAEFVV